MRSGKLGGSAGTVMVLADSVRRWFNCEEEAPPKGQARRDHWRYTSVASSECVNSELYPACFLTPPMERAQ